MSRPRCEDFPCCGHELGCCPRYDEETGEQLDMVCVCGARLPANSRFSICAGCMRDPDEYEPEDYESDKDDDDEFEDYVDADYEEVDS